MAAFRGLEEAVQDPDQLVKFLCSKFSQLIERVGVAEEGQREAQQRAELLRQKLRQETEQRQAITAQMQGSLRTQLAEAEAAQQRLKEARASADFASAEVLRAKEAAHTLNEECERLSSQCREEQKSLEEASSRRQQEEQRTAQCERERARLRAEVEAVSQRLTCQEEELAAGYRRDRLRRSELRQLETKLQDAGRQRVAAKKRLQGIQDELASVHKQVAQYKERLEGAQHMLAVSQEELQGEVGSRETAEREKLQTAQEEALAREGLERLRQLKARLEAALRENVEAHSQLKAIQLKHRSAQELADATDARQKEALSRLASIDICSAEADLERWQQRLQAVSESINKLRSTLQDLEESTKGASQVGLSLQEELQRVFLGTERLRQEREEA
ncbi:unnamed protein product, partial [Effrenium voratum]